MTRASSKQVTRPSSKAGDEVAIYDFALSATRVQAHFDAAKR